KPGTYPTYKPVSGHFSTMAVKVFIRNSQVKDAAAFGEQLTSTSASLHSAHLPENQPVPAALLRRLKLRGSCHLIQSHAASAEPDWRRRSPCGRSASPAHSIARCRRESGVVGLRRGRW